MKLRSTLVGALGVGLALTGSPADAASTSVHANGGAVGTTAVAAASTTAAPVSFTISKVACTSTAVTFTGRTSESGVSGVQQFMQTAREQELQAGRWVDITGTSPSKSHTFPNDSRNFFFERHWKATHPANGGSYRVIWQGFYLDGSGHAIHKTKPIPVNCP